MSEVGEIVSSIHIINAGCLRAPDEGDGIEQRQEPRRSLDTCTLVGLAEFRPNRRRELLTLGAWMRITHFGKVRLCKAPPTPSQAPQLTCAAGPEMFEKEAGGAAI